MVITSTIGRSLVRQIGDHLDIQVLVGHASHPSTLEAAGAHDADLLIAVTQADEVNMVACQVAHTLFKVPTRIARVRQQDYLQDRFQHLFAMTPAVTTSSRPDRGGARHSAQAQEPGSTKTTPSPRTGSG